MKLLLYIGLFFGVLTLPAQSLKHEFETRKMGTQFRVVFYHHASQAPDLLEDRMLQRIDELNNIFSDYDSESEAGRLAAIAGSGSKVTVSHDLWVVLQTAQDISKDSYGAFDVTIGPLSKLWRRAFRQKQPPTSAQIEAAQALVNFKKIKMFKSKTRVALAESGMRLDFGGIAKGYTLDILALVLQANGVRSYLIDAGGDIRVGLPPPEQKAWKIRVGDTDQTLQLASTAIACSGDTYKYLEWEGVRYSHIIDPRTGWGVENKPPVYIMASSGMVADALASVASILSEKSMTQLLRDYNARMWVPPLKAETP